MRISSSANDKEKKSKHESIAQPAGAEGVQEEGQRDDGKMKKKKGSERDVPAAAPAPAVRNPQKSDHDPNLLYKVSKELTAENFYRRKVRRRRGNEVMAT